MRRWAKMGLMDGMIRVSSCVVRLNSSSMMASSRLLIGSCSIIVLASGDVIQTRVQRYRNFTIGHKKNVGLERGRRLDREILPMKAKVKITIVVSYIRGQGAILHPSASPLCRADSGCLCAMDTSCRTRP